MVAASVALGGCFTAQTVPVAELRALAPGSGAVILSSTHGKPVRLDYNSYARFVRSDGSDTFWVHAGDLYLSGEGVQVRRGIPFADVRRARVEGMDTDVTLALRELAAAHVTPLPDGGLEIALDGKRLLELVKSVSLRIS